MLPLPVRDGRKWKDISACSNLFMEIFQEKSHPQLFRDILNTETNDNSKSMEKETKDRQEPVENFIYCITESVFWEK